MVKEGKSELLRLAGSGPALTGGGLSFAQALRAAIGQFRSLEVTP